MEKTRADTVDRHKNDAGSKKYFFWDQVQRRLEAYILSLDSKSL